VYYLARGNDVLYVGSNMKGGMGYRINEALGKTGVTGAGPYNKNPKWVSLVSHPDTEVVALEFDYERDWYWPRALEQHLIYELEPPLNDDRPKDPRYCWDRKREIAPLGRRRAVSLREGEASCRASKRR